MMPPGDGYRPPPRSNDHFHRSHGRGPADSYRPPPPQDSFQFRGAADRHEPRYDDYSRGSRYSDRDYYRDNTHSRGPNRDDHYSPRRPEEDFTFRAPSGPSWPPERPQTRRARPSPQRHQNKKNGRKERPHGGQYRGRFVKKQPHERDIFTGIRESTPEQLEGMGGSARFAEYVSSDESDEPSRKKAKVEPEVAAAVPKWSNPDPYTVLPPPESLGAPKKDIVQVIRKSKLGQAAKTVDPAKANQDYISFNFDDDDAMMDDDDLSLASAVSVGDVPPPNAPTAPKGPQSVPTGAPTGPKDALPGAPKGPKSMTQSNTSSFTPLNQPQHNNVSQPSAPPTYTNGTALADRVSGFSNASAGPGYVDAPPRAPLTAGNQTRALPSLPTHIDLESGAEIVSADTGRSKKRKHDQVQASAGDIVAEWVARSGQDPTPWHRPDTRYSSSPALKLYKEIQDFYDFVRPHDFEEKVRSDLIKTIESHIRSSSAAHAASIDLRCFGSFAAGLYLPTADLDLVAVSPSFLEGRGKLFCQTAKQIRYLGEHFRRSRGAYGEIVTLTKTRVPIIKFKDNVTSLRVDISFENDSGLLANRTFQAWKERYPVMPILVVLVKQLVAMHGLNEVHTGGIGGFSIICLVVSMLQLLPQSQAGYQNSPGDLLLHFLDLYGNKFNMRTTGINMEPPGYFDKIRYPVPRQSDERLTIRDPNNPDNDISGGTRKIELIFDIFRKFHSRLQRRLVEMQSKPNDTQSLLGCMLGGNYNSFLDQRNKLYMAQHKRPIPTNTQLANPTIYGQHYGQYQVSQDGHGIDSNSSDLSSLMSVEVATPVPPEPSQAPGTHGTSMELAKDQKLAQDFKAAYPHITQVGNHLSKKRALSLLQTHGEGNNNQTGLTYESLKNGRRHEVKKSRREKHRKKQEKLKEKKVKNQQSGERPAEPKLLTKRQRQKAEKRQRKLERAKLNEANGQNQDVDKAVKVDKSNQQSNPAKKTKGQRRRERKEAELEASKPVIAQAPARKWTHKTPPTRRSERLNDPHTAP